MQIQAGKLLSNLPKFTVNPQNITASFNQCHLCFCQSANRKLSGSCGDPGIDTGLHQRSNQVRHRDKGLIDGGFGIGYIPLYLIGGNSDLIRHSFSRPQVADSCCCNKSGVKW